MKVIKFLFKAILCVALLVVVALVLLPLWFGPVVKTVANIAVPKVVQTDFKLAHLSLNPYTARFELGGLALSNPKGYPEEFAAKVGEIVFDAETASLLTDVIHVEEVTVRDVFVSYVNGGENNVNNFLQIQYNVAGGKEKFEQKKAAEKEAAQSDGLKAPETKTDKPAKKIIIDKMTIAGVKVQFGPIPLAVPVDIVLTDIGRESGGATFEEAWQQICASVLKAAGAVGEQLQALGGLMGDAASGAAGMATQAAGTATKAVGDAAGATTKAVGDAAGTATKAVGGAANAVGEGAKKTMDAIKSLW